RVAADDVLPRGEGNAPLAGHEPPGQARSRPPRDGSIERVADTVGGADEGYLSFVIREGPADLLHEVDERRVRDDGIRPEAVVKLGLRDDSGRRVDQQLEQVERLRLEVHRTAVAKQLASRGIELERVETHRHGALRFLPVSSRGTHDKI